MPDPVTSERATGNVLTDALTNVSNLVRDEVDLARAEINENVSRAGSAIGMLAGAAVFGIVALTILAMAAIAGLVEVGMNAAVAALIVGVILAVVALVMMTRGRAGLKLASLAPTRTARNVKRDARAVKEAYNDK